MYAFASYTCSIFTLGLTPRGNAKHTSPDFDALTWHLCHAVAGGRSPSLSPTEEVDDKELLTFLRKALKKGRTAPRMLGECGVFDFFKVT